MPYPVKPDLLTSYTAVEQSLGDGSFPGQELDTDLAAVRDSLADTIAFLSGITRSDGALANGSVTRDTLAADVRLGFDPPEAWVTGVDYTTTNTVFESSKFYLCTIAHTSGTFATDLAAARWEELADFTPPSGSLLTANNLSDLADASTARGNLGLGTAATVNSGTGGSSFRTNMQNEAFFAPQTRTLTAGTGLAGGGTLAADRTFSLTGQALALHEHSVSGFLVRTGAATYASRNMQAGTGLLVANPGGGGNPEYSADIASQAEAEAGTASNKLMTPERTKQLFDVQQAWSSVVTATSGTAADITGIPSWANEVDLFVNAVSLSGGDDLLLQLGTAGAFVTSGYVSQGNDAVITSTAGMIASVSSASRTLTSMFKLRRIASGSNVWHCDHQGTLSDSLASRGSGYISLGTALTRVRLTRTGTDTFDGAGSITARWRA